MNAKQLLRTRTIWRLSDIAPDFPYFSIRAVRDELLDQGVNLKAATLPRYLHALTKEAVIFDAGRGWYSTLATPFVLNREPVQELVDLLNKRFPFLDFAVWSTAQIAPYGHNLLSRFVSFIYTDKDAMESVADAVRDLHDSVYLDPSNKEAAKNFRIEDKTLVIRPTITRSPVDGKYATIEKILVDLYAEFTPLNLMDDHEFKRLRGNIIGRERVSIGTLANYALDRRDLTLTQVLGLKIN